MSSKDPGAGRSSRLVAIGLALALIGAPGPLGAQSRSGPPECCLVLLLPVGARSAAMGRALTALPSADAVFTNPAGLSAGGTRRFLVHHEPLIEGQQANAFTVLFEPQSVGTIGLTYQLFDYGEDDARDQFGNVIGRLSTREQLLIASFATVVRGGLRAGLSYKLYQFRLDCAGSCLGAGFAGTTHAVDAGLRFQPAGWPHLSFGAAIMNLGFALQVVNEPQADPFPARMRAGVAYELLHHFVADSVLSLIVSGEVDDRLRYPGSPQLGVGVEAGMADALFVRAGYRQGQGRGTGFAVGLGVEIDRFELSISRSFASTGLDYDPYQFSFGLRF